MRIYDLYIMNSAKGYNKDKAFEGYRNKLSEAFSVFLRRGVINLPNRKENDKILSVNKETSERGAHFEIYRI